MTNTDLGERFAVLGSAVLDRIRLGDTTRDEAGGAALNVAVGLRRLGPPSHLIANISTDPAGAALRDFLDREDVTVTSTAAPDQPTAIVESRRERDTVTYNFATTRPSGQLDLSGAHLDLIARSTGVALSAVRLRDLHQARRLCDSLDAVRGPRLYDPNPRHRTPDDLDHHRREIDGLAPHVDLMKLGRDDITLLYDEEPAHIEQRLFDAGVRAVVITDGPRGCTLAIPDHTLAIPAVDLPGPVTDPMGAGDATLAVVAHCLLTRGWPTNTDHWHDLLATAMTAAALSCRATGAASTMPCASELAHPTRRRSPS